MIVPNDDAQANAELMQIANTLNSLRSSFGLRSGCQQKRGENCDDGNDNQKFNQCERKIFFIRVQSVFHPWLKIISKLPKTDVAAPRQRAASAMSLKIRRSADTSPRQILQRNSFQIYSTFLELRVRNSSFAAPFSNSF